MLIGAVIGRAVSAVINIVLEHAANLQITTITLRDQLAAVARPALAALAMVLAVLAARSFLADGAATEDLILRVAILVPAGAFVYAAAVAAIWLAGGRKDGAETEAFAILRQGLDKARGKLGWRGANDDRINA